VKMTVETGVQASDSFWLQRPHLKIQLTTN